MQKIIPWKKNKQKTVFNKYSKKIEKVTFSLPDGREDDYYLLENGRAVAVLAMTINNEIILTRQYRPGPNKILIELPGGLIENKETPEAAAIRELNEETGYTGDPEFVTEVLDDAYSTMVRSCVVIKNCCLVRNQTLDKNEFIDVVTMPLDSFRKHIKTGEMTDIEAAYLCLDYLNLL